ncbi:MULTISPECIES: transcriptional regulator [Billgrantia]|uniref:Transcriptional regulator n=2 Tax=Billgrantia TaxID=3137761 RepID=A0ABS9A2L4_9GAMM|nr:MULTISPECIES: transcriptional regulator [Halomonas]MCE8003071.1 transcriptional regulator [Halomonas ethanolica]MCE8053451.1 transcriptional regulator [Halomonas desiderata]
MNEKTAFAERLAAAMRAAGYEPRPAVLEREFNLRYWGKPVTLQGVRRWLCGETLPQQEKLQVLAEWLGVEPQTLRFGERGGYQVSEPRGAWEASVGAEERRVLQRYLALPVEQRKVVAQVIEAFARADEAGSGEEGTERGRERKPGEGDAG